MLFKIKNNKYNPRKWFTKNYSKEKTGKKFVNLLKKFIQKYGMQGMLVLQYKIAY